MAIPSIASRLLALALLLAATLGTSAARAAFAPPASAVGGGAAAGLVLVQDDPNERPSIFRFLFGQGRDLPPGQPPGVTQHFAPPPSPRRQRRLRQPARTQRQAVAPAPDLANLPDRRQRRATKRTSPAPARAAPVREPAPVVKAADAKHVLVIGDFAAAALAKGLTDDYAQDPTVQVIDATKGSSGLVRADVQNWASELPDLVAANKPDAILVTIGSNDRQAIDTPAGSAALGSDDWKIAYAGLAATLADALKASGKPALWVGLTPVRSTVMSRDYSTINSILHDLLESKGLKFIDAWNGFADENGKFASVGPDVTGQSVQLRASDGVNFTRAGQRKLAYFVEQDLNDALKGALPAMAVGDAGAQSAGLEPAEEPPRIGPMLPLDSVESAGGSELSGAEGSPPAAGAVAEAIVKRLAGDQRASAPTGRADDFTWLKPAQANPPPATPTAAAQHP
jgi:hypothetical protein